MRRRFEVLLRRGPVRWPGLSVPFRIAVLVLALASATAARAAEPSVATDKPDYSPGQTVSITGSGWQSGEAVTLRVTHADGTIEGGAGHDPWTIRAAPNGDIVSSWYVNPDDSVGSTFLLTAMGASGAAAQATFTDKIGLNLDQCQNGTLANLGVACGQPPTSWENGNINGQNSQYREGDGLPYRTLVSGIPDGTWVIRLQYDFTKGGVYALDRLTRFDLTQDSDPCLATSSGFACTTDSPAIDFEIPGEAVAPGATAPSLPNSGALDVAGSAASLSSAGRRMTIWVQGGAAQFVSAGQNAPSFDDGKVLQTGSAAGDSAREFASR
jgi:hypothetical protein